MASPSKMRTSISDTNTPSPTWKLPTSSRAGDRLSFGPEQPVVAQRRPTSTQTRVGDGRADQSRRADLSMIRRFLRTTNPPLHIKPIPIRLAVLRLRSHAQDVPIQILN